MVDSCKSGNGAVGSVKSSSATFPFQGEFLATDLLNKKLLSYY
jgi:hypothetical protein